jgi:hypothetical protein
MTEEEWQQWRRKDDALKKAENSAAFWKWTAILVTLFLLFCIGMIRGCIPIGGGGGSEPP